MNNNNRLLCVILLGSIDPKNASYYSALALGYRRLEYFDEAERYYRMALDLNSENETFNMNLGLLLKARGRSDEAISYLNTALKRKPNDVDLILTLADIYGTQKNYEEASKFYKLGITLSPERVDSYSSLGDWYSQNGQYLQAAESYEEVFYLDPNYDNANYNKIILSYANSIKEGPNRSELYFRLGLACEWGLNYLMDHNVCSSAEMLDLCELKKRNYMLAETGMKKVLDLKPINPNIGSILNNLGVICEDKNEREQASENYREALNKDHDHPEARYNMASLLFREGNVEKALLEFQEAFRLILRDNASYTVGIKAHIAYNIGVCFYRMKEYTEFAKDKWQEAIRLNPRFVRAYYNLGVLFYNENNKNAAELKWQEAIAHDSSFDDAKYNLSLMPEGSPHREKEREKIRDIKEIILLHI
ncbi:MAG: tetratricopeptide repeat protein [Candidatus Nitrosopolaris sp.]